MRHLRGQHAARSVRRGQRGMTLLEIMIVVAILGMLASVIVVAVMNQFDNAKIKTTEIKIKSGGQALLQYNVHYGEYPKSLEQLVNPPDGGKAFLKEKGVPKDAWKQPFLYYYPSKDKNAGPFQVISKGPDRQEGTDDDLPAKKKK